MHVLAIEPVVEEDPCNPDPCGPYANPPRRNGDRCDCSCQPDMIGSPPNCRPECIINNDCPTDKACTNQRCVDPCPGLCGINASCRVRNHIPICVCNTGYQGDPFSQCRRITSKTISKFPKNYILRFQPLQLLRLYSPATHLPVVSMLTVQKETMQPPADVLLTISAIHILSVSQSV